MNVQRRPARVLTAFVVTAGCLGPRPVTPPERLLKQAVPAASLDAVDPDTRFYYLRRAQVWRPTRIGTVDINRGPRRDDGFAFNADIVCRYADPTEPLSGYTPKFLCR